MLEEVGIKNNSLLMIVTRVHGGAKLNLIVKYNEEEQKIEIEDSLTILEFKQKLYDLNKN
jgi:hypothetical protein